MMIISHQVSEIKSTPSNPFNRQFFSDTTFMFRSDAILGPSYNHFSISTYGPQISQGYTTPSLNAGTQKFRINIAPMNTDDIAASLVLRFI